MPSSTPHHFRVFTILGILSGSFLLASCTPSPSPNATLVELLTEAQFDSQALQSSAPEISALRAEHATEISAEIDRLCGFTDEGTVPESCQVSLPAIAAAPTDDVQGRIQDSQAKILDQLDEIPEDSLALITQQYIDQAAYSAEPATPEMSAISDQTWELDTAEQDVARDLLQREYSAAWSLGVALTHVDSSREDAVNQAIDHHRERAALLRVVLADTTSPSSEPGYQSELIPPTDAASAETLISEITNNLIGAWHFAAATADTSAWRELSTQIAGDTLRDSAT